VLSEQSEQTEHVLSFSMTPTWLTALTKHSLYLYFIARVKRVNCAPAELLDALFGHAKVA
jgi:hypothetical protein